MGSPQGQHAGPLHTASLLSAQITSADAQWNSHSKPANKKAHDAIVTELDLLASDKAEKVLRWTKHKFYSCANKPGAMLASKLNASGCVHKPIHLHSANGDLTSDPMKISTAFANFLASLYSKPSTFPLDLADNFFRTFTTLLYLQRLAQPLMQLSRSLR